MTKKLKAKQIDGEWLETVNNRLKSATVTEAQITKFKQMNQFIQKAERIFTPLKDLESNLQIRGKNTYHTRIGAYYGGPGEEVEVTEVTSQRHLDAAAVINLLNSQLTQAIEKYKNKFENVNKDNFEQNMAEAKDDFVREAKEAFGNALSNEHLTTHRDLFSRVFEGFKADCNQFLGTKFALKSTESVKYVQNRYTLMNGVINKSTFSLQENKENANSSVKNEEEAKEPPSP